MVELKINIPDWAGEYLKRQVEAGIYPSVNDCVIGLLETVRRVHASQEKLAELIMEGENSGEGWEYSEEDWPARRDQIIAELQKKSA